MRGSWRGVSGNTEETDREATAVHSPDRSADERVAMLELLGAIDDKRVRCLDVTD